MNTFDTMTPGSAAIILFGVAFLGGAIGSFLNVVIYRLPAGLSLIHPPSRCPKCEHPIRSYDNIPVLGWILLRGKCRDCGQPISPRYPTIEAIVSLMFLVVAWLEWFGPRYGVGLPGSTLQMEPLVARAGLHVVLLTTMLGAGMIEWDGVRAPAKMWVPFILISIISWAFFPDTAIWQAWDYRRTIMAGLINGLVGAAVGLAVGEAFALFDRLRDKKKEPVQHHGPLLFGTLGIGLVFGWQVIVGIGMFYLPILLGEILLQRASVVKRILPHGLALFVLTLLGIVALCFMPF